MFTGTEGFIVKFYVDIKSQNLGSATVWAYESIARPQYANRTVALILLNTFPPYSDNSSSNATGNLDAAATMCYYNRKNITEVVMSIDYDTSFTVSLIVWIFVVLYVLCASAAAFVYVMVKKAEKSEAAVPLDTLTDADKDGPSKKKDSRSIDSEDENICEEDPIFVIYDYGTFKHDQSSLRSPRATVADWT